MKRRLQIDIAGHPGKGKAWRDVVTVAALDAWGGDAAMDDGPMRYSVEFWLPVPGPDEPRRELWSTRLTLAGLTDTTLAGVIAAGVITDPTKLVDVWSTKLAANGWVGARVLVAELS